MNMYIYVSSIARRCLKRIIKEGEEIYKLFYPLVSLQAFLRTLSGILGLPCQCVTSSGPPYAELFAALQDRSQYLNLSPTLVYPPQLSISP